MRIIYLAGPMSGLPDLNKESFERGAAELRALGYKVVSPTEVNGCCESKSWLHYMRVDLKELLKCNTIALLDGWHKSRGASIEAFIAGVLGYGIYMENPQGGWMQVGRGHIGSMVDSDDTIDWWIGGQV